MKTGIKILFGVLLVIVLSSFTLAVTPPQVFGFDRIINLSDGFAYFDKVVIGDALTPLNLTASLGIIGEVQNIDDVDGISRFLELNLNNGTNAIAGFTATNNLNRSMIMGITGGNFSVASPILVDDQPFLFSNGGNDMAFGVGSANGFVWRNDLGGTQQYSSTTNVLMTLASTGLLTVGDVNSSGLFKRIDNVTEINSDIIHNVTLPVLYVTDTTNNEVTINITFGIESSFQVWDAKKKFNLNSVFVNVLNSDGVTIDHSAELDTKDKAFQFYFNGTFWNYAQIGKGQFVPITSPHDSITDFGNLIVESDNNTDITIIGSMEFTGIGIGSQKIISMIPTSVLESNANWKGVFIDGGVLDPTGEGADIVGFEVDFSQINTTNSPVLHGIEITVPPRFDAMHIHEGQLVINNQPTSIESTEFAGIDIRVDTVNLASSSVWSAIGVTAVGSSSGTIAAVLARNQVEPIRQEVGSFSTPSQTEFAGIKENGGVDWVDGVDGVEIFVANSDEVYLGSSAQFSQIEVIMGTPATKDVQPTFHYSTGADSWTEFFPDDETSGFQSSSLISWEPDSISALWTGNGDPGGGDTTAGFWIKMIRIREEDPGTPIPTTMKTGTVEAFGWDATGLITINNANVSNNLTIANRIIFGFGEMIDNLVNGVLRVTGDLNVTGDISVGNNVTLDSGATFWSNSTCAFISSPAGTTRLEVCDA